VIAPYHLRLGWLMWFLPFSVLVTREGIFPRGYETWFIRFVEKLLEYDRATLGLLRKSPFPNDPPRYVRARYFLYQFTTRSERRESGNVWKRSYLGDYLSPVSRETLLWR